MNASDPQQLLDRLDEARRTGLEEIAGASDQDSVEAARVRILGRKAPLASIRSALGNLPEEQRKEVGRVATEVQRALEDALAAKRGEIEEREHAQRWQAERIDVTLPGEDTPVGILHPLTRTLWEIIDVFIGLGYRVAEGPDVELAEYNYDALNFSRHHPARTPHDVFYVDGTNHDVLLRTHTSPVQIRTMENQQPPVYVVIPG
ncbi:MAG: phenylalanine--tRNA ligase subunit alpha, partial [Actinomycetota bacterium]|nr:phenylalanine--tRNA ligase subunit alpha [Actinomycetota bacterium]